LDGGGVDGGDGKGEGEINPVGGEIVQGTKTVDGDTARSRIDDWRR